MCIGCSDRALRIWLIALAVGATGLASCVSDPPAGGRHGAVCSPRDSAYFAGTPIEDRTVWYGRHLRAAGEGRLCPFAGHEQYRFTWLRTFHAPVIIVASRGDGAARLRSVRLSGAGGYEPGSVVRDTTITLTEAEWKELRRLVAAAKFWRLPTAPPDDGTHGLDGANWIIEGTHAGRYHVVDRWSPLPPPQRRDDERFAALGLWLLRKADELPGDTTLVY